MKKELVKIDYYSFMSIEEQKMLSRISDEYKVCDTVIYKARDKDYFAIHAHILPEDCQVGLTLAECVPLYRSLSDFFGSMFLRTPFTYSLRVSDLDNISPTDTMNEEEMEALMYLISVKDEC